MIKLLAFDLDGVIVNTGSLHLEALNMAIEKIDNKFCISEEEDSLYFGSITSKEKLKKLTILKGLPVESHESILKYKKYFTEKLIKDLDVASFSNNNIKNILLELKSRYRICLTSNTNIDFIKTVLSKLDILDCFEKIYDGASINLTKPHSKIYLQAMIDFDVNPQEVLAFEDSVTGQEAVIKSGAHLFPVNNPNDLSIEKIDNFISSLQEQKIKWKSNLNVLIPCAGNGSRFANVGYKLPKPIIDVNGQPMVGLVCDKLNIDANFIFVIKEEHVEKYNLETMLTLMKPDCTVVKAQGKQEGAVDSILRAKSLIDNDQPLLIVNSDQIWEWDSREFYYKMMREDLDGGIVTFVDENKDPKWSFAKVDEHNFVTEVAEKKPISTLATAGIYYFKKGSDFVKYAEQMIAKNIRVNNEFYTSVVYNEFIQDNKKIKTFNCKRMIGLGVPEDLELYLKNG